MVVPEVQRVQKMEVYLMDNTKNTKNTKNTNTTDNTENTIQVGHPVVKTLVTDGAGGSIRERGCRSRQAA